MAATIHPLFGNSAGSTPTAHPMLTELRDSCLGKLDEIVRRMFDSADDALFEMGEKATNDVERRQYFDTMRVLRIDRNRVAHEFSQRIARGFAAVSEAGAAKVAGAHFDLDALSIQPTEELEEKIALSNLATKVEGLNKSLIWDIERRLEIAEARGIPVSPQALSPSRICEAFGAATAVLDTEFRIKLVVFKLFDRVLSRDLHQVYAAAIETLDREGIERRRPSSVTNSAGKRPGQTAPSPLDLLRQQGVEPAELGISDDAAADSLKDMLQVLIARGGQEQVEASAQRLSMAGNLFNKLLAEPLLDDSLRAACEALRYPLYRTALTDADFFTSATHPARKMLTELVDLAAASQSGDLPPARLQSLLQAMVGQAETMASAAQQNTGARGPALSGVELDGFLGQLREQARARREALLLQVRRIIAQELELRTVGREVPKPVQNLLRSGVGPLMAVRLLRNGRGSEAFRDAETLLEQVISTLDTTAPVEEAEARRRLRLIDELKAEFKDIGMTADRSVALLDGLRQVYGASGASEGEAGRMESMTDIEKAQVLSDFTEDVAAHRAEVADATTAAAAKLDGERARISPMDLLNRVLTPESWFRVFDASQNQTRWLKLSSFYANRDSVTFTGFDESTRLSLRATRLAEDLIKGHSEPINPTASAREALEELRLGKARGLF